MKCKKQIDIFFGHGAPSIYLYHSSIIQEWYRDIRRRRGGKIIIISMKNTDFGMDSDIIQGLLSKLAAKSATGTGLGQFVSQNITEANGGKI